MQRRFARFNLRQLRSRATVRSTNNQSERDRRLNSGNGHSRRTIAPGLPDVLKVRGDDQDAAVLPLVVHFQHLFGGGAGDEVTDTSINPTYRNHILLRAGMSPS